MENFKDTAQKCLLNTYREVKQVKHDNQIIGKKVKIWGLIVAHGIMCYNIINVV